MKFQRSQLLLLALLALSGFGGLQAADRPSLLALPPCFGHGMVLQQRDPPDRRDDEPILWGWAAKYETVYVELPGQPKPIEAVTFRREGFKLWQVQADQLKAPLRRAEGATIRIRTEGAIRNAREISLTNSITNVAIGDVWVLSAVPRVGVPSVGLDTNRLASLAGRVRVFPVTELPWTNWTPNGNPSGPSDGWRVIDARVVNLPAFPATAAYFGFGALQASPETPVGIILARPETLRPPLVRNQWLAGTDIWSPSMRRGLEAADSASRACDEDFQKAQQAFAAQMKQAKRRGEVAADLGLTPPQPLNRLRQASSGPLPALGYGIAGAFWGQ